MQYTLHPIKLTSRCLCAGMHQKNYPNVVLNTIYFVNTAFLLLFSSREALRFERLGVSFYSQKLCELKLYKRLTIAICKRKLVPSIL